MVAFDVIWPNLYSLEQLWENEQGAAHELLKAHALQHLATGEIPARPKVLIVGALSPVVQESLGKFNPSCVFLAYLPALGMRAGTSPSLVMDTDLPPFSRSYFDLVVMSYALEYHSVPLGLLSLGYEILQPHGRLALLTPHRLGSRDMMPGFGKRYWGWSVSGLLRRSAFSLRDQRLLIAGRRKPTTNLHLAQPQVPPQPSNRLRIYTPLMEFWRSRQRGGIAASDLSRH